MQNIITIAQIAVSIALIVLILLQQRDSDLSGFLGGGAGGGGFYQQRRGMERMFFVLTIVLVVVFAGLALYNVFYTPTVVSTPDTASSTPNITINASSSAPITITPTSTQN